MRKGFGGDYLEVTELDSKAATNSTAWELLQKYYFPNRPNRPRVMPYYIPGIQ